MYVIHILAFHLNETYTKIFKYFYCKIFSQLIFIINMTRIGKRKARIKCMNK